MVQLLSVLPLSALADDKIREMRIGMLFLLMCVACRQNTNPVADNAAYFDTTVYAAYTDTTDLKMARDSSLPEKIVAFAKTQLGVPYRYCSMSPEGGFDCSGFVNYVFNHFDIKVPRSSSDFTNEGEEIDLSKSMPGDIILFTGTNPRVRVVGHVGIITSNYNGAVSFIQSTSGEAYGVVISPLDANYQERFMKVIRIVR
jgi:cell wall-associated NlpC family hydrolase